MISDELKKIRGDSVVKGEDYPLKTCIMEWFIWGFCEGIDGMKFDRECFLVWPGIDPFLLLLFFDPVFLFCGWRVFLTKNGVVG